MQISIRTRHDTNRGTTESVADDEPALDVAGQLCLVDDCDSHILRMESGARCTEPSQSPVSPAVRFKTAPVTPLASSEARKMAAPVRSLSVVLR